MVRISHLRVNHLKEPLGYQLNDPVFTFRVSCDPDAPVLTGVRVHVCSDPDMEISFWDSGWTAPSAPYAFSLPVPPAPQTRYYWQVYARTDSAEFASETSWFETSRESLGWDAEWITSPLGPQISPVLWKTFTLPEAPVRARVSVCGLGLYALYIDGQRIGEDQLTPFFTAYDSWVQYQTYDVTAMLKPGEHTLAVMLGDGWYKGRFASQRRRALFGDEYALILQLDLEYASGKQEHILSGNDWKCNASPVLFNGIYDGEILDGRMPLVNPSLCMPVRSLTDPGLHLKPRLSPGLHVQDRLSPVSVLRDPQGRVILDFGQNMAGWVEFDDFLSPGECIELRYGEILVDSFLSQANLRTAKAAFVYYASGKGKHIRPHFTYFGFRYVQIEGAEDPASLNLVACVLHSDMEPVGHLSSGHELLNRLIRNIHWSQLSNFVDIPTDCPQRDERFGWTGDAQVFCQTSMLNADCTAFWIRYLTEMRLAQVQMCGSVPFTVPDVLRKCPNETHRETVHTCDAAGWSDAAVIIPWTLYMETGDPGILRRFYPLMRDWSDRVASFCADGSTLWLSHFQFGDWLALDAAAEDDPHGKTDEQFLANAFAFLFAGLVQRAAIDLGLQSDTEKYAQRAETIRTAILAEYYTDDLCLRKPTQTAAAISIAFDLVPRDQQRGVRDQLIRCIHDAGDHLCTGFLGTPVLCTALTEAGKAELAWQLLLNTDYPGWLYPVTRGATTIWERWNSLEPDGSFRHLHMNSLNHYASGCIGAWLYRNAAGIQPVLPGYRIFRIHPHPDIRISHLSASLQTPCGLIRVSWRYTVTGNAELDITVPFGSEAILEWDTQYGRLCPEIRETVSSSGHIMPGEYHFTCMGPHTEPT